MELATETNQHTRSLIEFCSQPEWLALPIATRGELRKIFGIRKSGQVKVQQSVTPKGIPNDRVISDGTQPEDLMSSFNVIEALKYLDHEFDPKHQYEFSKILPLVLKKAGLDGGKDMETMAAADAVADNPLAGKPADKIPAQIKAKKPRVEGRAKIKIKQQKNDVEK